MYGVKKAGDVFDAFRIFFSNLIIPSNYVPTNDASTALLEEKEGLVKSVRQLTEERDAVIGDLGHMTEQRDDITHDLENMATQRDDVIGERDTALVKVKSFSQETGALITERDALRGQQKALRDDTLAARLYALGKDVIILEQQVGIDEVLKIVDKFGFAIPPGERNEFEQMDAAGKVGAVFAHYRKSKAWSQKVNTRLFAKDYEGAGEMETYDLLRKVIENLEREHVLYLSPSGNIPFSSRNFSYEKIEDMFEQEELDRFRKDLEENRYFEGEYTLKKDGVRYIACDPCTFNGKLRGYMVYIGEKQEEVRPTLRILPGPEKDARAQEENQEGTG